MLKVTINDGSSGRYFHKEAVRSRQGYETVRLQSAQEHSPYFCRRQHSTLGILFCPLLIAISVVPLVSWRFEILRWIFERSDFVSSNFHLCWLNTETLHTFGYQVVMLTMRQQQCHVWYIIRAMCCCTDLEFVYVCNKFCETSSFFNFVMENYTSGPEKYHNQFVNESY